MFRFLFTTILLCPQAIFECKQIVVIYLPLINATERDMQTLQIKPALAYSPFLRRIPSKHEYYLPVVARMPFSESCIQLLTVVKVAKAEWLRCFHRASEYME